MGKADSPVPPEFLERIGRITANFAVLESVLQTFIGRLISSDHTLGQIISAELSFRGLVALLSSLYKYRVSDSARVAELDSVFKRVNAAEEKRNIVVHSLWMVSNTDDSPPKTIVFKGKMTAKISKGLRYRQEQVTIEELDSIAEEISNAAGDAQAIMLRDFPKR